MENSVRCTCAALGHWFSFGPWVGKIPWRKEWQPTPVFLPGEFRGQRSLVGYNPWDHKESDTTEQLTFSLFTFANPLVRDTGHSQVAPVVANTPAKAGDIRDVGSVPGSGRSPGGGHSNPLQYFCLEHPVNRRAWRAIVHWVPQSQIRLK